MSPAAQQKGGPAEPRVHSYSQFTGMNLTPSRTCIDDKEVYVAENAMPLGQAFQAVPLYNGGAGTALHAGSLVKESLGCQLTYGANTIPHPVSIVIFEDGSCYMRDHYLDGATDTLVAAAGTFSASGVGPSGITIWQDGPILFLDPTAGYCKWDGTTFTVIDATKKGSNLAVFESHVWLQTAPRTITYTAPNSFSDFTAGNGAGSFKLTDDAFPGAITNLHSTVEQLWISGVGAIDALGNVATAAGVTTFSVTNAITSLGAKFSDSFIGFFRALTFFTGYSMHSLLGVTPQKLSAKIERLIPYLGGAITAGPRPGIVTLNGQTVLCLLFAFADPVSGTTRSELVCFQEGKIWLARTPDLATNRVRDMVTLYIGNVPEVYGIDAGGFVYRIFARTGDAMAGTFTVSSKLYDFGEPTQGHQGIQVGVDLSAPASVASSPITLTLVSEGAQTQLPLIQQKFLGAHDSFLNLAYAFVRPDARIAGERIGLTVQGNCADLLCVEALHFSVSPSGEFQPVGGTPSVMRFTVTAGTAIFTL